MAMNAMGAGFVITAKDAASAVIGRVGRSMGGMLGGLGKSFKSMNAAGGPSIGAIGMKLAKVGGQMEALVTNAADNTAGFDHQLSLIQTRGNITAEAMAGLRAQLMGEGFAGKNLDNAAEAWARMTEETGNAQTAFDRLKPTMNLARVANIGNADAASMLADVMDQFGIAGEKAGATADKLAFGMGRFGIMGPEMQTVLAGTSSGAALLNASFDDTLVAVGLIKQKFPNIQKAAMAANLAMNQLSDPKVRQELKRIGVQVTDDEGKFRPLTTVLGDLSSKTAGWTDSQKASALAGIFNRRSAGGLNVIMEALAAGVQDASGKMVYGAEAAAALGAEMNNTNGVAADMSKSITNDYKGASDRMANAMDRLKKTIGPAAQSVLRPFKEGATAAATAAANLVNAIPQSAQRAMMGFSLAFGKVLKAMGYVGIAMGAMKLFGVTLGGLVFSAVKAALVLGGLTLLLGGLAIGFYALYRSVNKNATGVGDSWRDMVGKVKLGWKSIVEIISNGKLSAATSRELKKTQNQGVLGFVHGFERFLERMKVFWVGLKKGFDEGITMLGPQARMVIEKFKSIFSIFTGEGKNSPEVLAEWGAAGASAGRRLASFGETALTVLSKLADVIGVVVDRLSNVTGEDIAGWIDGAVGAFNTLASAIEKVGDVLSVIGWVLDFVWHTLRVVGAFLGETVGTLASGSMNIKDIVVGTVTGDQQQAALGVQSMRDMAHGKWYEATQAESGNYARDLFGVDTTVGMTPEEKAAYYKDRNLEQAKQLQADQEKISTYMGTSNAEFAAGANPLGAKTAFGNLDAKTQAEYLAVFDRMSKAIKDLGGRPVNLYVDREKIASAVGDSGTAQGTRSLDEGDALI
jgi:TP901 family phage tail tape measure protein